ncbi:dCTP deaminase [Candidatus Roizmanbacteria bacterium RIFCSPHIGHO2_02_FULL_40_13b]|uniref:dCTP deaminase n=1 Tax=Candidatus Roizmanbacteria bacterium RIFCSPHIGHO2_01_FULL_39_24 TaxID=1802032 RepID=A0A1F7GJ90_9BACT|nr:MAG: dCTP deaminase [Candidatus Roizmanbacteria bacterium RIFCSPHIGHO2_01_FULL_39_24]OGK26495.1 MAG: dCTP deaminase [Candidatus Roizmanbacteria bacterium RIFCSPHIGHO2_02_FULL_40_13b]
MILSDVDIKKALASKYIRILPKPDLKTQLSSCSIDFRLSNLFYVFEHSKFALLDPHDKDLQIPARKIAVKKGGRFVMHPGAFVIGSTIERVELPDDLVGRVEGRSSLGRLGIVIHSTAPLFDPGWRGQLTLELGNIGVMPVALYPGMRICAMTFEKLSTPSSMPYYKKKGAKYLNQKGPTVSKIVKDIK